MLATIVYWSISVLTVINVAALITAVINAYRRGARRAGMMEVEQAEVIENRQDLRQIPAIMGPDPSALCLLVDIDYVEQQRIVARQGLQ
jgi:hypothetical protein